MGGRFQFRMGGRIGPEYGGFLTNGNRNLYDRVLVTVWVQDCGLAPVTAWTYDGRHISGPLARCTDWPPV